MSGEKWPGAAMGIMLELGAPAPGDRSGGQASTGAVFSALSGSGFSMLDASVITVASWQSSSREPSIFNERWQQVSTAATRVEAMLPSVGGEGEPAGNVAAAAARMVISPPPILLSSTMVPLFFEDSLRL